MAYTALYRKFRPRDFAQLAGQEPVKRILSNAVARGQIVHAYLFCGPRGTGKTSVAKILAKAVNCLSPEHGSPCGVCAACARISAGESLDIMEIDAASNRGIDEIRDLRERVKYAPAQEKHKIYIIDEVHMMTGEAFNALLKTLEEPPPAVIFILATTEPHKIPLTVLSRCQRFDFQPIAEEEIRARLREIAAAEGIRAEEAALALMARKAGGSMRDAVSLLDQCSAFAGEEIGERTVAEVLGALDGEFLAAMARALTESDLPQVLRLSAQLLATGKDLRQFVYDLLESLRELLLARAAEQGAGRVLAVIRVLSEADSRLRFSLQPGVTLELSLIQACGWREEAAPMPELTLRPSAKSEPPKAEKAPVQERPAAKQEPLKTEAKTQTQTQTEETAAFSLDSVKEAWPKITSLVQKKSLSLHAFLAHAKPGQVTGKDLVLHFASEYLVHMENAVNRPANKALLEEALQQVLGIPLNVRGKLAEIGDAETVPPGAPENGSLFGSEC
ncbi:MAG: DNA polymerase III subunit gamma/tau [Clostridiales bacterium]|nr:DNA polymerase III subunit gamma/tau [Clostridiales bacterium]